MSDGSALAASPTPASAEQSQPIEQDLQAEELDSGEGLDEGQEASSEDSGKPQSKEAPKDVKKAVDKLDAEKVPGTKLYKIVVDGVEEEVTESQLVSMAQKSKAADKRFNESAQIKKEAAQLVKMLREDPEAVLADPAILGSSDKVLELAQKILARKIEDEQKSPEVLRAEKAERELEQFRKSQKEEQERKQKEDYERMMSEQESKLEEEIQDAISSSGMPKSPLLLKRMADVMISAAENDKDISPKQAMNIVKRELTKDLKEYFDLSPDEVLEELLGDNNIKRLRKRQIAKVKASQPQTLPPQQAKAVANPTLKQEEKPTKVNIKDWLRGK
jgi:hypothetical protein